MTGDHMILLSLATNFPEDEGQDLELWSWITELTMMMTKEIGHPMEIGKRDGCPTDCKVYVT